jgi:mRNA interferase HigB
MRVISRKLLRNHWQRPGRRDSESPLKTWWSVVSCARWSSHDDVKAAYNNVDIAHGRHVFDIGGNKYRLICRIDFERHGVLTLWIGTHAEYDRLCANAGKKLKEL